MRAVLLSTLLTCSPVLLNAAIGAAQPRPMSGPRASDGETMGRWIAERVRRAREGHQDIVELPLVFPSDGWGCSCPSHFVGVDPEAHEGGETWVRVRNQSGDPFPRIPTQTRSDGAGGSYRFSRGMVLRVEGYFEGGVALESHDGDSFNVSIFVVTEVSGRIRRPERARARLLRTSDVGVCDRIVSDTTPLNVRQRPRGRARVLGTLPNGTRVHPLGWRGNRWIRIGAPIAGWVWVDNTTPDCSARSSPR